MKKSILALAIAGLATTSSAFAAGTFDTNMGARLGGYYDTESEAFYTDFWTTGVTVSTNYTNGNIVGYVEADLDFEWTTDEDATEVQNDTDADVDKAWFGYKTAYGVASYGWENDTALDKVDGKGDMTVEFGSSASDASDAYDVIKFQGATSGVQYAVSYFKKGSDTESAVGGVNGYVGYKADSFEVYGGYETRSNDFTTMTVTGNAHFGSVGVGANVWVDDNDGAETNGVYVSASYALSDALTVAAGLATVDDQDDAINVSASYAASDVLTIEGDVKNTEDATSFFLIGYYDL
jgi:hypothetical protein